MIKERKNNSTNLTPIVEPTYVFYEMVLKNMSTVVATTCHSRTNDLTMSKALQWAIK